MSGAKHTPGPWLIDEADLQQDADTAFSVGIWSGSTDCNADGAVMVAHVSAFGLHSEVRDGCEYVTTADPEPSQMETATANARLIAAAPELLEALQAVHDALGISYPLHR